MLQIVARGAMQNKLFIVYILVLALSSFDLVLRVQCSVHQYSIGQFVSNQNGFVFYGGSEGMHATTSLSKKSGVSDGRSFIRFDSIKFTRPTKPSTNGNDLVQAIIFEVSDRDNIGAQDALCCTADLAKTQGCKEGEVIIRPSVDGPFSIPIKLPEDTLQISMHTERINITKTGFYNVFFVFCDPKLQGLAIDGATVWKNPTGYLPGSMAPLLSFFGNMSLAYIVLAVVWFLQCIRQWKGMMKLQNQLTVIITLSMLEMTLWYFDYTNFNSTGFRPVGITIWAVTIGTLKKTFSRLFLLAVSMGYGVVRPGLSGQILKLLVLGATYFFAVEMLDMFENVGAINDLTGSEKIFLVLPVAVLDGIFVIWIFVSLSRTLEKLQAKKWTVKLDFYRKLTNTLSICIVVAVSWIGYEFYFKTTDYFGEQWESAWIISAFWNILAFALLCLLCVLFAPSQNSAKFECCEETAKAFDNEEDVLLTSILTEEPEKTVVKTDRKDKRQDDDAGDGKRE